MNLEPTNTMSRKPKHEGKHDDGSFEAGEGSAEAMLDAQLSKPLDAAATEADDGTFRIAPENAASMARGEGFSAPRHLRGTPCPAAGDAGDKTPEVFEWHVFNSADVVQRYAGRKAFGALITEDFIKRVRLLGLKGALDEEARPAEQRTPLSQEITDATREKVKQAEAAQEQ